MKWIIRSLQLCVILSFLSGFGLYGRIYDYQTPTTRYLRNIEIAELDSGMPGINCIYVINLDARPNKWAVMQDVLHGFDLRANRVSSVKDWVLNKAEKDQLLASYRTICAMNGRQIGCLLSHISIMQDAYKRGFEKIWILEDDTDFNETPQALPALLEELTQLDPGWDVFYTDTDAWRGNRRVVAKTFPKQNYFRPDQTYAPFTFYAEKWRLILNILGIRHRYGLHSYVVSRARNRKNIGLFYPYVCVVSYRYVPSIRQYSFSGEMTYTHGKISDTFRFLGNENP